jgi:hypothetical protein
MSEALLAQADSTDGGDRAFVVRLATAYLVVPHDASESVEYARRLADALAQDPRVTHAIAPPQLDKDWSPQFTVYSPMEDWEDLSGVLDGRRHVHVQRFSDPIVAQLRVPAKNQPKVFESDEIPSERYTVLWDGQALLVAWSQPAGRSVGGSGGHVVEEVLEEAAERADTELLIQACNPQCTYVFVHTAIRAVVDENAAGDWSISRRADDPFLMDATLAEADSVIDAALETWARVRRSLDRFAAMKNRGRQILELERVVRRDLDELNQLHHRRAQAQQEGLRKRVGAWWSYRSWRRTSRFYLARLWLGLGSLERLKRLWVEDALSFRRATEEDNLHELFTIDTYDEVPLVEQLDLSLVEAAVEHADDRLTANALLIATAGGAVAGGVVAALIGAL